MSRQRETPPSPSTPYLSYYDICLTYHDMDALREDWLTDNNISFFEEYLEKDVLSQYPSARIILMRPSMVMLLSLSNNTHDMRNALPRDISESTHIFLPINDNNDPERHSAGTHWSLLVIGVADKVAFHYDSMLTSGNAECAERITQKLSSLLNFGPDEKLYFFNLFDTPQQNNGSDCGVHVLLNMRHLLVNRLLMANSSQNVDMSMRRKRQDTAQGRRDMINLIENIREEAIRGGRVGHSGAPRIE